MLPCGRSILLSLVTRESVLRTRSLLELMAALGTSDSVPFSSLFGEPKKLGLVSKRGGVVTKEMLESRTNLPHVAHPHRAPLNSSCGPGWNF